MATIKELVDQIIQDGVLTREEHDSFIEQVHADGQIDEEESAQISRLFRLIQDGTLKVVDEEREKAESLRRMDLEKKLKGS
jgi:polyhydroxyalkanoate synthesis regulator phasin